MIWFYFFFFFYLYFIDFHIYIYYNLYINDMTKDIKKRDVTLHFLTDSYTHICSRLSAKWYYAIDMITIEIRLYTNGLCTCISLHSYMKAYTFTRISYFTKFYNISVLNWKLRQQGYWCDTRKVQSKYEGQRDILQYTIYSPYRWYILQYILYSHYKWYILQLTLFS